jgi:hypothetical protein
VREVVPALQAELPRSGRDDGRTRPVVGPYHHHALGTALRAGVKTRVYLYRAVDRDGQTVDFRLSGRRDVTSAKAFFRKAIKHQGRPPRTITLDGYAASHRALREMKADGMLPGGIKLRSSKYLNNLVEQDHRGVKLRLGPMLRLKWFRTAAITIGGIELLRRIHKGQFDLGSLRRKDDTRLLYGMPCSQLDRYAAMWARCRPEQEFAPQPERRRIGFRLGIRIGCRCNPLRRFRESEQSRPVWRTITARSRLAMAGLRT